ncbi:MAG TPA: hypothetical protein PLL77_14535 [Pyrinomonadaceae bacterium]|nr:hypothetical protein [Pyrinomonadaceae bacterium]
MNDYIRRNLESGQRCRQWFIDYAALIPGGSIFKAKANGMTAKVNELENTAGEQEAASSEGFSATDVKGSEHDDLIAALTPVRTAARAAEFDIPGTRERYRFNVSMTDQELLAAGRSFALGGATDEALLVSYDAPAGWVATVTAACDAFEATFGLQSSAKGQSVAKNAEMYALVKEMNAFKGALRHHVINTTLNNPGARAAWQTAAHVEKAPTTKKDDDDDGDPPTP